MRSFRTGETRPSPPDGVRQVQRGAYLGHQSAQSARELPEPVLDPAQPGWFIGNVADIAIVAGVGILIMLALAPPGREHRRPGPAANGR